MAQRLPPFFSIAYRDLVLRSPRAARRSSRLSAAVLLAPALAVAFEAAVHLVDPSPASFPDSMDWFPWGFWIAATAGAALYTVNARGARFRNGGQIEVSSAGRVRAVRYGLSLIAETEAVAGIALDTVSGPAVELHLGDGGVIRAGVGQASDARALLDRLGLGRDRRRIALALGGEERPVAAGAVGFVAATFLVVFGFFPTLGPVVTEKPILVGALFVVAATLLARWLATPGRVVVGAEGVSVGSGRGTLVPFTEIRDASNDGPNIILELRRAPGAASRRIVLRGHDAPLATGIVDRIRQGTSAVRRGQGVAVENLEPAGRTVAAWRQALAGLLAADASYRSAAIQADDLLAVVEDVSAPPLRRIGAALALRECEPREVRGRVRIAADACADDEVRAALEAAAAEELDEAPIRRMLGPQRAS